MKHHYAVTISDTSGSKHFFVSNSVKSNMIIAGVAVLVVLAVLFVANTFQSHSIVSLSFDKKNLNKQLVQADYLIANFKQKIVNNQQQATNISKELVAIEKFSGVDTGDSESSLEERIARIGNFYNDREEEYSEIGTRVEKIEAVIGVGIGIGDGLVGDGLVGDGMIGDDMIGDGGDEESAAQATLDLASRVEIAGLTASQERMLHDNIPNGYPLKAHIITSRFGMRDHPVTKVKSFHNGIDLRAKIDTELFAPADGFVSNTDYSKLSGNRIVILHNFGFETRYSHLNKTLVSPGDVIHKGDLIGYSGNTGRSLAPHLHYEIRYLSRPIDPFRFLGWEFGTHEIFTQVKGVKWPSLINLINKQITHQTLQLSQLDRTSPEK